MNETNIKHGYSLMVHEARGAILNPGIQNNICLSLNNIHLAKIIPQGTGVGNMTFLVKIVPPGL